MKEKPQLKRHWIDSDAFSIVETLQKNKLTSYLVGGCVRDLLLGIAPKDFDIATMAHPHQVKRRVYGSYIIGKRFRLVLVKRGEKQFEVATFRRNRRESDPTDDTFDGDNLFGTPEEDSQRRDFTINALFYDPVKEEIIDYIKGQEDLEKRVIRIIGDPDDRLREDPIRILRALRLAYKIHFTIEPRLRESMEKNAGELLTTALPRRREEILKLLRLKTPALAFQEAHDLGILAQMAPTLDYVFQDEKRTAIFSSYLERLPECSPIETMPTDLFSVLVLGYYRAVVNSDPHAPVTVKKIIEDPELLQLMKHELGMFNYEQSATARALHMQSQLKQVETFQRRGEKRRLAVVSNSVFPLALFMSKIDYSLSPTEFQFWQSIEVPTPTSPSRRSSEARKNDL